MPEVPSASNTRQLPSNRKRQPAGIVMGSNSSFSDRTIEQRDPPD